jgi:hypothetical protein
MSETPDIAAEDVVAIEDELPTVLPQEAPEADVMEQARGVRAERFVAGGLRVPRSDSPIEEANEADRQEQAEDVTFDEDDETR